jgi:hypothetical protein
MFIREWGWLVEYVRIYSQSLNRITHHGKPATIQSISPGFGGGGSGLPSKRLEYSSIECASCVLMAYLRTLFAHSLYTIVPGEFMLIDRDLWLTERP